MLVRLILIPGVLIGVASLSLAIVVKGRKLSAGLLLFSIAFSIGVFAFLTTRGITPGHHAEGVPTVQSDDT